MYIKKLDICGFKSFVEKTSFIFSSGITAVVGPNGCGKSNIIDAVQWVMGEQSVKQLRGKSREDIIFAGAEDRHPMNMAEVVMTLVNTNGHLPEEYRDLPEISIGRRLFRSGETEYFINKRSCRLKDIHNIFLGTGVGTRAYSIIQQGRIGAIIEANPEEIRYFIEEAAGTTRYKNQKREALRKIEKTRQNLFRVNDIIGEIRRQRDALNRQAKKAERFKKYRDQVRDIDILLTVHQYRQILDQFKEGYDLLKSLKDADVEHGAKLAQLDAAIEKIKWERVQREKAISEQRNRQHECQRTIDKGENDILHHQKDMKRLDLEVAQLRREREEIAEKNRELAEELSGLEEAVSQFEIEIEKKLAGLREKEKKEHHLKEHLTELKASLEREKGDQFSLLTREAQYKNTHQNAARNKTSLNQRIARSRNEEKKATALVSELDKKLGNAKADIETVQAAIEKLNRKTDLLETELREHRGMLGEKVKDVQILSSEFQEVRSRYNALRKIDENYEWLKGGARAIMQRHSSRASENGVCGLVADIVEPEPSFELAVEAALGDAMQHVIVRTQEEGIKAISYLSTEASGRGSFIPINTFKPLSDMVHCSKPNQTGLLLNHVTSKEGYEVLVEHLLGHVVVAANLHDALSLWNRNGVFQTVVTKDGDRVSCDGILTGGSPEKAEASILAKKREIKRLGMIVADLKLRLEASKAEQEDMEASACILESKQQKALQNLRSKEAEKVDAEKALYRIEEDLKHARRHLEIARLEVEQTRGEESDLEREISQYNELLAKISEEVSASKTRIATLDSQVRRGSDDLETFNQKVMEIRLELTSLKAKRENARNDLRRLESFQIDGVDRIDQLAEELEEKETDIEATKIRLRDEKDRLEQLYAELKLVETTLFESETAFQEIDSKLTENGQIVSEVETVQKETQQKIQQLELEQSERRLKSEHLTARINERYHEDLKVLADTMNIDGIDLTEKEGELARLREKMAGMGDVNLAAIKEFETLNERLNFYNTQYEDLEKAVENLQKVIRKINKITKKKFLETFTAINEKLQTVFPTLFEGGTARLDLTDPDNPLESGVEILIHPPGKKLLRMSLLSGGEKTLAALAFIFSIYLIKPSPFCLLDEIDAPLDDVNVDRFTNLLKNIAERSQVVLVTHNKQSMEMSDILFGVTMECQGVSKLVSVSLREIEEAQAA
jgi:chromosome segregation protein